MALASVTYIGDGSTQTFSVPFPYLVEAHVIVKIDDVPTTDFTWATTNSITMDSAPANLEELEITRVTPTTPLVDYQEGSILTEALLDTATLQALYLAEEANDGLAFDFAAELAQAAIYASEAEADAILAEAARVSAVAAQAAAELAQSEAEDAAQEAEDELATLTASIALKANTADVNGQLLGVGQTWQDMLASRAADTDYTNSTGRTIMVSVSTTSNATGAECKLIVDGVDVARAAVSSGVSSALNVTTLVPPGSVYRYTSRSPSIWAELR